VGYIPNNAINDKWGSSSRANLRSQEDFRSNCSSTFNHDGPLAETAGPGDERP
jgi:hypothetical protein